MFIDKNDYPALGFKFKVTSNSSFISGLLFGFDPDESYFQSVSGIGANLSTMPVINAGLNNIQYQLPNGTKYTDLDLSRGLMKSNSPMSKWVMKSLTSDLVNSVSSIKTRTINVFLLEKNSNNEDEIVMSWTFFDCYPKGFEIGSFNSNKSEIAIESLKITYSHFSQNTGF
ncbi:phage tail protein [Psychroflexus salis]|uniref:Phage tail protein n=1 Tax=Psychroflexus salis TaxID=1526574 RepID=A0A916ZWD7_9FLAO|nr:phage tail protein [Psychroflexus salis]GGE16892.1 hypothetical protein GCM10010831_17720 [Psychroflexus salis]